MDLQAVKKLLTQCHSEINQLLWFFLWTRLKLHRICKDSLQQFAPSKARRTFVDRTWSLRSIANLGINKILFSFWHILHYPLFLMMVMLAIFHVLRTVSCVCYCNIINKILLIIKAIKISGKSNFPSHIHKLLGTIVKKLNMRTPYKMKKESVPCDCLSIAKAK